MVQWLHSRPLRESPFALVLAVELVSVLSVFTAPQHWLRAVGGMTVGLALAGVLRAVLSDEQAGLLRVRRRAFDVLCYLGFGVLTITFALALPQR